MKEYQVVEDNQRIDSYLALRESGYSRSFFQRLIIKGFVLVNSKTVSPSRRVHKGDTVKVTIPERSTEDFSKVPLEIIYEDSSILVINKPAGINVHPAGRISEETTIADIISAARKFKGNNPAEGLPASGRLGLVHRLDRDTSGVMVVAKNESSQFKLMNQFRDREVKKTYLAIVHGKFNEKKGSIEAQITRDQKNKKKFRVGYGKSAMTEFKVLETNDRYSYLEIHPLTGRTHQIRVHLSSIDHPILGDKMYGKTREISQDSINVSRQMLHAYELKISHPATKKPVNFTARIPADFKDTLKAIKNLVVTCLITMSFVPFVYAQETTDTKPKTESPRVAKSTAPAQKTVKPAPAPGETAMKEIKELKSGISDIEGKIEEIKVTLGSATQKIDGLKQMQDDVKESNSAITELNRKLSIIEQKFEQFKAEAKLQSINDQDKEKSNQIRENLNERSSSATLEERVDNVDADIALLKKELSRIQENMGIEKANQKEQTEKIEKEEPEEENTFRKLIKAPWVAPVAFGLSVIAILVGIF